ncbi:MAG TPA: excinuclease ABC subunit UvrA [Ktedonobacteraceae bacterium]
MPQDKISIRGARAHNLKNIDVTLPRDKLVVITGLSGSGKSSLAFDTIFAEGQRRYMESLSTYARQFLDRMEKPDVDSIDGLSPALAIDQKGTIQNPRSTVGTVTEIYDYLRLLYARIGHPHCPKCGREISQQTVQQIVDAVLNLPEGSRIMLLAPLVKERQGAHEHLFDEMRRSGFVRVRVDGKIYDLSDEIELDKQKKHTIEVVVDRLVIPKGQQQEIDPSFRQRVTDSLETALKLGSGIVQVAIIGGDEILFSEQLACVSCGISLPEIAPHTFSFNSPHGACPTCAGLGALQTADPELVKMHAERSVGEGVIAPQNEEIESSISTRTCPDCHGTRLKPEALAVTLGGRTIAQVTQLSIVLAQQFFQKLASDTGARSSQANMRQLTDIGKVKHEPVVEVMLTERERLIARQLLKEIQARLQFLLDVGLDYLTLDRAAASLSGGEAQRIHLATQIGSGLTGVLYVLDEPSIGLHQHDNARLIKTLSRLRDLGNTVLVVEHDEETMRASDHIVDIGPGAGERGGQVVAEGTYKEIMANTHSLTGDYLARRKRIPLPEKRREGNGRSLIIKGAREHNLKNVTVEIPLGKFVVVTGVSGSGKSTLITDILYRKLARTFYRAHEKPGAHDSIEGLEYLDKVIGIDQSPIGRTPRSNPATYSDAFTGIRELFARVPEARIRGYRPGRFSLNVKGGRCEACQGEGIVKIEMNFLPDVYVPCEVCQGKRYNREALEIHYKGKNIAEVLDMTVEEAMRFFAKVPAVFNKLKALYDVGLGYIHLGQPATTLSGGEAQRVKLARELARQATGRTMYILDEPTAGLHFADIERLLQVLQRLADAGNSIVVIEHNMEVVKSADWIIDLGPEAGDAGGQVIALGTPEDVAENEQSLTGYYLRRMFTEEAAMAYADQSRSIVAA